LKVIGALLLAVTALAIIALIPGATAAPTPTLAVSYTAKLDEHYSLYGSTLQQLNLEIQGNNFASSVPLILTVLFYFDFGAVSSLGPSANYTITRDPYGTSTMTVTFPASTTSFDFAISGSHQDFSLLYRSVATIQPVSISLNVPPFTPTSSTMSVEDPPGLDIFSVSGGDPGEITQDAAVGGSHFVTATLPTVDSVVILYQTSDRDLLLFLYLGIAALAVVWIPFAYRRIRLRSGNYLPRFASLSRRVLAWFNSTRMLEVFVGLSLAMIGIALIFGPSPVPRVYLAATPATTNVIGPTIAGAGFEYLTPANAGDQFDTMSTLGNYNLIILADYPPAPDDPGIAASDFHVFVMTQYVPQSYAATLTDVYGKGVILLNNTQELGSILNNARFYVPASNLGLPETERQYKLAVVAEAILTFLLVFVAMALLARVLVERGEKGLSGIAEGAFYSVTVFMLTTIVFIQTSELLGLPVALHAGISTVESAVGALGFGGGSRPRQLVGSLGFFLGAIAGTKGKMKIDRIGILAFIGVITFIAIDPLTIGQSFYQLVVTFTTSDSAPTGAVADQGTRGILGTVMDVFGHSISNAFYSSHGTVLYFLSALPFALFSKVRKSTATFLLLFSGFAAPLGFIRVADLNPTESMASAIPGIVLGLGVVVGFVVASFIESRVRKNLPTI